MWFALTYIFLIFNTSYTFWIIINQVKVHIIFCCCMVDFHYPNIIFENFNISVFLCLYILIDFECVCAINSVISITYLHYVSFSIRIIFVSNIFQSMVAATLVTRYPHKIISGRMCSGLPRRVGERLKGYGGGMAKPSLQQLN